MLTKDNLLDLEEEMYKLSGIANLLEALVNHNDGGYEMCYISEGLNDIVKNIQKILDIS